MMAIALKDDDGNDMVHHTTVLVDQVNGILGDAILVSRANTTGVPRCFASLDWQKSVGSMPEFLDGSAGCG